jgi:hypothetical protein
MLVFMGPVSLVVNCQQKLDFSPLLHWLLWERSWVRTLGSVNRRAVDYVGSPFFSGAVDLFKSIDGYVKDCYMWTM